MSDDEEEDDDDDDDDVARVNSSSSLTANDTWRSTVQTQLQPCHIVQDRQLR